MKLSRYAAVLIVALSVVNIAQAKSGVFYHAPFSNVEVKAASKIYVDYEFSAHTQTLTCTSAQANTAITSVEWSYKDATRKLELPITLKDDENFPGYFADPAGKLVITNEFGQGGDEKGSIFVSCEYRNMK